MGVNEEWTTAELSTLRRIIKKAEADPDFSKADIAALRALLEAFRGLQYLGRFAKWGIFALAAIAATLTAWSEITEKLRTWLVN